MERTSRAELAVRARLLNLNGGLRVFDLTLFASHGIPRREDRGPCAAALIGSAVGLFPCFRACKGWRHGMPWTPSTRPLHRSASSHAFAQAPADKHPFASTTSHAPQPACVTVTTVYLSCLVPPCALIFFYLIFVSSHPAQCSVATCRATLRRAPSGGQDPRVARRCATGAPSNCPGDTHTTDPSNRDAAPHHTTPTFPPQPWAGLQPPPRLPRPVPPPPSPPSRP